MKSCFVIQPFDKDKFDRRYQDIFKPAIKMAEMNPYRVDEDYSVRIPIQQIEEGIRESDFCFADITIDNPNVWYELGYAFACKKDVVLVCSDERDGKFPFDIQHRQVIMYNTGSTSDFDKLEKEITRRLKGFDQTSQKVETLNKAPVQAQKGLESHEIAMLAIIIENQFSEEDTCSANYLQHEMSKAGYTDVATSVGLRTLTKKGLIKTKKVSIEVSNNAYIACRLTDKGEEWILSNLDKLEFRKEDNTDDLPF